MKKFLAIVLTFAMVLALAACGGAQEAAPTEAAQAENEPAAKEGLTVGYSVQSMENAYFVSIVDGMKKAAEERGIKLIVSDAGADASKHINHIEDFVAQGVDAIIISPVDQEAPVDAVKNAIDSGIPVVSLDQEVFGSSAFYGIDEHEYGYQGGVIAGNWLNDKEADGTIEDVLNADGQIEVVVVRYDTIKSLIDRGNGLKDGILETYTGSHEVVFVYEQEAADADAGFNLAETALTAHPDIAMFVCINDSGALGVYESCLQHPEHTPDNTCIVGLDALEEPLKLISEGTMYKGTVSIEPSKKGADALDIVAKVLENGPIAEKIVYEMTPVSTENVAEWVK